LGPAVRPDGRTTLWTIESPGQPRQQRASETTKSKALSSHPT